MARMTMITVVLAAFLAAAGSPRAQTAIRHAVIANGGGHSSTAGLRVHDTVGQSVVGAMSAAGSDVGCGYWYAAAPFVLDDFTAVAITSFSAVVSEREVQLRWAIGHADGLEGFNIYRAPEADGAFEKLNRELLAATAEYRYRDGAVKPNHTYWYKLGAVDRDGEFFSVAVPVTTPNLPTTLHENFPNPFNPSTTLPFYLAETAPVELDIYNAGGQLVRRLLDETRSYGRHEVQWDGRDNHGVPVASGVYFYRLRVGKLDLTKKLTLLK